MSPSALILRSPRLCTVSSPSPSPAPSQSPTLSLPDRDALGAGLLVTLSGCGFDGGPCVGLKIREDNRDERVRRARANLPADATAPQDGDVSSRAVAKAPPLGAAGLLEGGVMRADGGRGLIGQEGEGVLNGRSRVLLFGAAASICGVVTALGSAAKVR